MANSFVRYTGDAATDAFAIPFSYINSTDLTATENGVVTAAYTLNGAGTILTFNTPPALAAAIEIRRTTSQTTRLTDYADGSVLTENDLDTDSTQSFYMSQEAIDDAKDVISLDNVDFQYDVGGKRLKNVGDPVADQDAVTKAFISTNIPDITTVAGIAADVSAVAADAADIGVVAADNADIGIVAANIADVSTVATDIANVITVANDLNEVTAEIDTVATSIANVDTVGLNIASVNTVAGIDANVTTVAGISADVTTVAANDTNVTTVGTNIASVNDFADRYRISATAPTTSLTIGDLYFNTTTNIMQTYSATGWIDISDAPFSTMIKFVYTATAAQTVFTGADDNTDVLALTVGSEVVTLNGVTLEITEDYTATTNSITLLAGAAVGDDLNIYAFANFNVPSHYSKTESDAKYIPIANIGSTVEAYDATILKDADIGSTVEAYDATIVKDADIGSTVQAYDATILKNSNIGVTVEAFDNTIVKDADIGVNVEAYDATIVKDADIGVNVEAFDATIVKDADIGVNVQAYDANIVSDAAYVATANDFTTAFKTLVQANKLKSVTSDNVAHTVTFTKEDDTTQVLNLDDITTDISVSGASLDASSNILTLTGVDQPDVTVDLSDFVNTTEQTAAQLLKQDLLVSATNIKTVNGTSLLGAGDLVTAGYVDTALDTADAYTFRQASTPINGMSLTTPDTGFYKTDANIEYSVAGTAMAAQARLDLDALLIEIKALSATGSLSPAIAHNQIITAGTWDISGATGTSGTTIFDAEGDADAIFVIRVTGTLSFGASNIHQLDNGAKASNIFWVGSGATGAAGSGNLAGTIIPESGGIAPGAGLILNGRMLCKVGAINVTTTSVNKPADASSVLTLGVLEDFLFFANTSIGCVGSAGNGDAASETGGSVVLPGLNGTIYGASDVKAHFIFDLRYNGVALPNSTRTVIVNSSGDFNSISLTGVTPSVAAQNITVNLQPILGTTTISKRNMFALKIA
jgi:hypothetical protein